MTLLFASNLAHILFKMAGFALYRTGYELISASPFFRIGLDLG